MLVQQIQHDNYGEIVLNHPPSRNAITGPMGIGLTQAINVYAADDSVQLILLCGAEGAFCSGLNLKDFNADPPPPWMSEFPKIWRGVHKSVYQCPKPIVVALEKFAINGGAALALAADILIAGDDSYLQVGEVTQGMAAPYNMAWLRLRYPEYIAAQLTMIGRRFTGSELHNMGIAYAAPTTAETAQYAQRLCRQLSAYPKGSLQRITNTLRNYRPTDADAWFDQAAQGFPASRVKPGRNA